MEVIQENIRRDKKHTHKRKDERRMREGKIKFITPNAVLIETEKGTKWFPKSVIKIKQQEKPKPSPGSAKAKRKSKPITITKLPPWKHQQKAFDMFQNLDGVMLDMDMGTGKSKVIIDLIQNENLKKVLIVCPKSVILTWEKEPQKHMHESVKWQVLPLYRGSNAKKADQAEEFLTRCGRSGTTAIIVINYEAVWRDPFASWALSQEWDLIVADESQKIKTPGAKAAKWFEKAHKVAKKRACLSGTPLSQSPADAFAQYRFLDPKIFGHSFFRFRNIYFNTHPVFPGKIMGFKKGMEEKFRQKYHSISYRVTSEDVLDLPEAIHDNIYFELDSKTRKHYRELENEFFTSIKEKEINAMNAAVKILRLQQLTGGFIKSDEGELLEVGKEKASVLADLLDGIDPGEPIVIFGRFHNDLDMIRKVAESQGRKYHELSGRRNELREWQDDPEASVLAVQINSGGAGVDLTKSCYVVYYSAGYSLGDFEQSLKRAHRPGQTRTTYFYYLIAKETIDEKVYQSLKEKKDVIMSILQTDL